MTLGPACLRIMSTLRLIPHSSFPFFIRLLLSTFTFFDLASASASVSQHLARARRKQKGSQTKKARQKPTMRASSSG
jgi:putative effector of murein hydrolase LrgA (UPF0299 family)